MESTNDDRRRNEISVPFNDKSKKNIQRPCYIFMVIFCGVFNFDPDRRAYGWRMDVVTNRVYILFDCKWIGHIVFKREL